MRICIIYIASTRWPIKLFSTSCLLRAQVGLCKERLTRVRVRVLQNDDFASAKLMEMRIHWWQLQSFTICVRSVFLVKHWCFSAHVTHRVTHTAMQTNDSQGVHNYKTTWPKQTSEWKPEFDRVSNERKHNSDPWVGWSHTNTTCARMIIWFVGLPVQVIGGCWWKLNGLLVDTCICALRIQRNANEFEKHYQWPDIEKYQSNCTGCLDSMAMRRTTLAHFWVVRLRQYECVLDDEEILHRYLCNLKPASVFAPKYHSAALFSVPEQIRSKAMRKRYANCIESLLTTWLDKRNTVAPNQLHCRSLQTSSTASTPNETTDELMPARPSRLYVVQNLHQGLRLAPLCSGRKQATRLGLCSHFQNVLEEHSHFAHVAEGDQK